MLFPTTCNTQNIAENSVDTVLQYLVTPNSNTELFFYYSEMQEMEIYIELLKHHVHHHFSLLPW